MPMSPLDSILGLEGLFIEQVQRAHDIHIWARPRKRACCVYCANPRVRIKATYTRTLKHTRQGNQLMWRHTAQAFAYASHWYSDC